jgi:periplasmic protein CpxP/Spy
MGQIRKYLSLGLLMGAGLSGLGSGFTAAAQDWKPGPPPMERSFQGGMRGRWWDNPRLVQQIGLTPEQQKKMDDIMQQNRLKLIDLNATLQKQETIMQPLMEADQPDEGKILAQIDAIAQARAELEKGHARMLLGIRQVLTPDQWKKLQTIRSQMPRHGFGDRDGLDGRDGRRPGGLGGPAGAPDGEPHPPAPPQ